MEEGSWSCDKALQAVTYTCFWGFTFIALKILIWAHFRIEYFKGCSVHVPLRLPVQPYNFFPCSILSFFFFPPLSSLLTGKHQRDFHTPKWVVLQYSSHASLKVTVKSQYIVNMHFSCSYFIRRSMNWSCYIGSLTVDLQAERFW